MNSILSVLYALLHFHSGGVRNLERGAQACLQIFGLPHPLPVTLEVQTESTLGLVKCLEISKELIHDCVRNYAWLLLLHATPA